MFSLEISMLGLAVTIIMERFAMVVKAMIFVRVVS
nr:MAG TPA: hypothetical protein [Caudoviricetes sp.]